MVTYLDTSRKQKEKKLVFKTGPAELGPSLTEVPDMAKTSEAALVQVCSIKLATSVGMGFFSGAPLDSGRLILRCCLCLAQ